MVSGLLTVLKIIGIVILVILGLVLFLLLLVLFVPVRYRGGGCYKDASYEAGLRASWLLHMVSARAEYRNGQAFHIWLKLFGIPVYDNLRAADTGNKKSRNKKAKSTKNKTEGTGEIQAASTEDTVSSESEFEPEFESESGQEVVEDARGTQELTVSDGQYEELSDDEPKKWGFFQKIKRFFSNFVNFFKNIKFTFGKICDTIVRIKDNIKYYLGLLQLDSTKQAVAVCRKQFMRVFRKISPKKYRVNLHLGFDDPAVMGEVLAVWGMLYPLHQGNIDIQPEFDSSVIEGDFSFRGCISVSVFVRAACILFFDKDIRRLVKRLRRSES